jgi:hypothetical protein
MVRAETVDAITALGCGEPMVTDNRGVEGYAWPDKPFRVWTRPRRDPVGPLDAVRQAGPNAGSVQSAADFLLETLTAENAAGQPARPPLEVLGAAFWARSAAEAREAALEWAMAEHAIAAAEVLGVVRSDPARARLALTGADMEEAVELWTASVRVRWAP